MATLIAIVAAASVRFALAPFDNECMTASVAAPLAGITASFVAKHRVWSIILSGVLTVAAGMVVGQMGSRFRLYPSQNFMSMPLYGITACGIFISDNCLAAAAASLLAAMALNYICLGYLRERDLSAMLYAGLCTGSLLLLSTSGAVWVAAMLPAIFIFSFSTRELFVLLTSMIMPVAAFCYAVWALGGEFTLPAMRIWESLTAASGVATFGDDAVGALLTGGLLGFTLICSMALFLANRFMVAVKSRGILIYITVLSLLSAAMLALPSSTPADFAVAAVPMATIMPVLFIREGERLSAILYLSLIAVFILHLLYY